MLTLTRIYSHISLSLNKRISKGNERNEMRVKMGGCARHGSIYILLADTKKNHEIRKGNSSNYNK